METVTTKLPIVAEIGITYKTNVKPADRPKVTTSKEANRIFAAIFDVNTIEHKEMMYAMYMNNANSVLGVLLISEGDINRTMCDPRIVFQGALKLNASSVILCHNHPSGNLNPSPEDQNLARTLVNGGKILNIRVLDSQIIVPDGTFYSMADEGMM